MRIFLIVKKKGKDVSFKKCYILLKKMEEVNKKIYKKIFENLIIAVAVILYFVVLNFSFIRADENLIFNITKIMSIAILFISILIFELAYHRDSGKLAINGIEILVLALNNLVSWNIIKKNNLFTGTYFLYSSIIFLIYYGLKSLIIFTNERKKYYDSLSDIHEIVKKEPTKKEAKKRTN